MTIVASTIGLISRRIVTSYVAFGLVLQWLGDALGTRYDDRGVRGLLNVVSLLFSAVTWGIGEIARALNGGHSAPGQRLWVPVVSLGLAVVLDLGIATLRRRMRHPDRE